MIQHPQTSDTQICASGIIVMVVFQSFLCKCSLGGLKKSSALYLDLSLLSLPRVLIIQASRVSQHMITDLLNTYCLHITPLFQAVFKSLDSESQQKSLLILPTSSCACF